MEVDAKELICNDTYVICPYCGEKIEAFAWPYEDFPEAYEAGDHVLKCEECGKSYNLSTYISFSWTTTKMEKGGHQ